MAPKKIKITGETNKNAKILIIVESPSKCAKIESYLGPDYCCIASKGHLRTVDGLKSIDTKNGFTPKFSIIEEKKDHINNMRTIVNKFKQKEIILASDDDREGEAIAWHICELFELPIDTTKRIIFHEVTKPALQLAIANPTLINMNLVKAQHARQVLDILVGYKISPYLWKYLYHSKSNSLSAGRCQSPALRIVYDNDKEKVNGSDIEMRYNTTGVFFTKNIKFTLNHEFEITDEVLEFMEKSKTHEYKLKIGEKKDCTKSVPKPFHTSRLLQAASNNLNMSPKETMNLCQKLYQNGYITYMRTESSHYSKDFLEIVEKYIITEFTDKRYIGDFERIENKDTTNPHEAIRVTKIELKNIENSDDKRLSGLYKLIWRNTLESCMSDARYNNIKIELTAPNEKVFENIIEIPLFLGWKKVADNSNSTGEKQNEASGLLMYLQSIVSSKQQILCKSIDSVVVVRNKHQHYTEAGLINKLESLGIGRPSTFASIVDTIQERGYVKKLDIGGSLIMCKEFKLTDNIITEKAIERTFGNEKNKLLIQPLGVLVIEFLIKSFDNMFSYEYTKVMETKLDLISSGEINIWSTICKECCDEIKDAGAIVDKIKKQAYRLDDTHEFKYEKYGPTIKHKLEDGSIEFLPVKQAINIDLKKLEENKYSLEELVEIKSIHLGQYDGKDIYLKTGKFGPYVEWGEKKESIKTINKESSEITLKDIDVFLSTKTEKVDKNVLRTLTNNMSVRKGKFGPYVYYKRNDMNKPDFLSIKTFNQGFFTCEIQTLVKWVCEKYNLPCE